MVNGIRIAKKKRKENYSACNLELLEQGEDEHVGGELEDELREGGRDRLAQVEVVPGTMVSPTQVVYSE